MHFLRRHPPTCRTQSASACRYGFRHCPTGLWLACLARCHLGRSRRSDVRERSPPPPAVTRKWVAYESTHVMGQRFRVGDAEWGCMISFVECQRRIRNRSEMAHCESHSYSSGPRLAFKIKLTCHCIENWTGNGRPIETFIGRRGKIYIAMTFVRLANGSIRCRPLANAFHACTYMHAPRLLLRACIKI